MKTLKRINLHQEMMHLLLAIYDLYQSKLICQISCLCQSPNINYISTFVQNEIFVSPVQTENCIKSSFLLQSDLLIQKEVILLWPYLHLQLNWIIMTLVGTLGLSVARQTLFAASIVIMKGHTKQDYQRSVFSSIIIFTEHRKYWNFYFKFI